MKELIEIIQKIYPNFNINNTILLHEILDYCNNKNKINTNLVKNYIRNWRKLNNLSNEKGVTVKYFLSCGYSLEEAKIKVKNTNTIHNVKYFTFTNYSEFIDFTRSYYILKNINYNNKQYLLDFFNYIKDKKYTTVELKKSILSYIKRNRTKRGTTTNVEYWISLGYNKIESEELVKKHQKRASKLSVEYWLNHGYTKEYAKEQISKIQKKNTQKRIDKYSSKELSDFSYFSKTFWINKGYTEQEAILQLKKK
jgi:hypothetical protein